MVIALCKQIISLYSSPNISSFSTLRLIRISNPIDAIDVVLTSSASRMPCGSSNKSGVIRGVIIWSWLSGSMKSVFLRFIKVFRSGRFGGKVQCIIYPIRRVDANHLPVFLSQNPTTWNTLYYTAAIIHLHFSHSFMEGQVFSVIGALSRGRRDLSTDIKNSVGKVWIA